MPFSRNATLHVDIDADASGVNDGVDEARGHFSKLGTAAKFGGLAIAGGLAIGAKAAVDAIGAASDLNETISKSRVIFGKHADEMEAWAKQADTSMGLSENAALDAATSFGDMLQQLGFSGDRATDTSKKVVQLATDLGSFNNLPTADVLDSISGAFRGEYDSLQRVIPNISAARVQQEALNETHKQSVTDLTAAEKATATLAIVQHDGARAAGDFARTSGGLANQQKILHAQLENVQASIGQKLLPVAVDLAKFTNDKLIPSAQDLAKWMGKHVGPALSDVGHFIEKDVVPAAEDLWHWFATKIAPSLRKDVQPIIEDVRGDFHDLGDTIHDNGPELRDLLHALGDVAEFTAKHLVPILVFFYNHVLKLMFGQIDTGIRSIAAIVHGFEQLKNAIENVKDAISGIHFPSPPGWLDKIPGLEAPSYALTRFDDPARFGTAAGQVGDSIAELIANGGSLLATAAIVDARDMSLSVTVDGSGIVDERRVAEALAPVLRRHAERLGIPTSALLAGVTG